MFERIFPFENLSLEKPYAVRRVCRWLAVGHRSGRILFDLTPLFRPVTFKIARICRLPRLGAQGILPLTRQSGRG